jgi:hypothetical protein
VESRRSAFWCGAGERRRAGHLELTDIVEQLEAATTEAPVAERNSKALDPHSKAPAAKLSGRLVIPCVESAGRNFALFCNRYQIVPET